MSRDDENGEGHVDGFDESEDLQHDEVVTIQGEDDTPVECAVVAVVEHDGRDYAMLMPVEQMNDEDLEEVEVYVALCIEGSDGERIYAPVDDDQTYEAVCAAFEAL